MSAPKPTPGPCGCNYYTPYGITYCSLHEAAPDLLKALVVVLARNEHSDACSRVGGECICWRADERAMPDAEFLCRAANNHAQLVEVLEAIADPESGCRLTKHALDNVRAAIVKARGGK